MNRKSNIEYRLIKGKGWYIEFKEFQAVCRFYIGTSIYEKSNLIYQLEIPEGKSIEELIEFIETCVDLNSADTITNMLEWLEDGSSIYN